MDHIAAAEEQIVSERLQRKLGEVNEAAQSQLSPVQDHINFTLQVDITRYYRTRLMKMPENCSMLVFRDRECLKIALCLSLETEKQAYFKCAYECFDRRRNHEEISNCVEHCSVPVVKSQQHFENEMAQFQERLNRSLMVCQDKFEVSKLQKIRPEAVNDMESCVHKAIEENLSTLPHIVQRLKKAFNISD